MGYDVMGDEGSPLQGEYIWITGASSGIGKCLALRLAQSGAIVIASGRNEAALQALNAQNTNIKPLVFDVTATDQLQAVRRRLASICPHLNRIVLNAGNCEYLEIDDPDWSLARRLIDVNFLGAVNALEVALPLVMGSSDRRAHVVAVSSMATLLPFARAEGYGASKAALSYWFKALRIDLGAKNIDVSIVNPGFVKTPLTDKNDFEMPFLVSPEQAARQMEQGIIKRKRTINFPRRLYYLLQFLAYTPWLWERVLAPRMMQARTNSRD